MKPNKNTLKEELRNDFEQAKLIAKILNDNRNKANVLRVQLEETHVSNAMKKLYGSSENQDMSTSIKLVSLVIYF